MNGDGQPQQQEIKGSLGSVIEEAHTAGMFNALIKTQHELLLSEMKKIEALNELITAARQKRAV
jgi:hypothetical protein